MAKHEEKEFLFLPKTRKVCLREMWNKTRNCLAFTASFLIFPPHFPSIPMAAVEFPIAHREHLNWKSLPRILGTLGKGKEKLPQLPEVGILGCVQHFPNFPVSSGVHLGEQGGLQRHC